MKGRDSRKQTIIVAAAAAISAAVTGAIIGITAVTPFVFTKGSEAASKAIENAKAKHAAGMPAAQAKKAELDALKKEQKQLEKDKKTLEKKKQNARKNQAKKIYEERVANGYEASLSLVESEADKAVAEADKFTLDEKKSKKSKKSKKDKSVVAIPKKEKITLAAPAEPADNVPTDDGSEPDYSSSASMFKGISF
ncbi:MAG: hypothetical protein MJ115_05255 [Clostridia bacterium]|nr:hypothetical protein [Clostridia bacterium]